MQRSCDGSRHRYVWDVLFHHAVPPASTGKKRADGGSRHHSDCRDDDGGAQAYFERAKLAKSTAEESDWLRAAADQFDATLNLDPENLTAHYGLAQVHARLGNHTLADHHRERHEIYRRDDNAHDHAVAAARRRDAAANHASEAVVIYDLQRKGAYGLSAVP